MLNPEESQYFTFFVILIAIVVSAHLLLFTFTFFIVSTYISFVFQVVTTLEIGLSCTDSKCLSLVHEEKASDVIPWVGIVVYMQSRLAYNLYFVVSRQQLCHRPPPVITSNSGPNVTLITISSR